jgi:hypothetical protein
VFNIVQISANNRERFRLEFSESDIRFTNELSGEKLANDQSEMTVILEGYSEGIDYNLERKWQVFSDEKSGKSISYLSLNFEFLATIEKTRI